MHTFNESFFEVHTVQTTTNTNPNAYTMSIRSKKHYFHRLNILLSTSNKIKFTRGSPIENIKRAIFFSHERCKTSSSLMKTNDHTHTHPHQAPHTPHTPIPLTHTQNKKCL